MADIETDDSPDPEHFTDPSPNPARDPDLAALGTTLAGCGVTRVVIRYAGSGDEGSVEEIAFEPADAQLPDTLEAALQEVAEDYCPLGYENNEGGSGSLTLYPCEGLAEREHRDCYEDAVALDTPAVALPDELRQGLAELGVQSVTAHFDGYADSGQIDSFQVEPASLAVDKELEDALDTFLLDQLPGGWEINEGSSGDFTVDVPAGQVEVCASWRVENDSDAQVTRWRWR